LVLAFAFVLALCFVFFTVLLLSARSGQWEPDV